MPRRKIIRNRENVLLYLDRKRSYLVKAEKGKNFHTHKGIVEFDDFLGEEF